MAVRDVMIGSIILFVFAIILFTIYFVSNTITTEIVKIPQVNTSTKAVEVFQGVDDKVNSNIDYIFLGLFIGITLGIIITGWLVGGITIFAIIYIIIIVLTVIISSVFAYVWQQVTPASVFGTAIAALPITNHILNWLPLYMAIIGFIGIIVMFAKPQPYY